MPNPNLPEKSNSSAPAIELLVGKFLDNQKEELRIREKEVEYRETTDKRRHSFAQEVLKAQTEDRKGEREY